MTPAQRLRFARALAAWADALDELLDAWPADPDEAAGYPAYLPSVDEHARDVHAYGIGLMHSWAGGDLCHDEGGSCSLCGVSLDACLVCGGRGYHRDGCAEVA